MPIYIGDKMISAVPVSTDTPDLQEKSVDPVETTQDVRPDEGYDALSEVHVGAISTTYVGSAVPKQTAKTVTPTAAEQTAVASGRYTTGAVKVAAVPTETKTITENGSYSPTTGKWFSAVEVNVPTPEPVLQSKSATPSETAQTITADSGFDGLDSVSVGAISKTYVGSGITRRSQTDLSATGATVSVPAGYYASATSKAVASGSVTNKDISVSAGGLITAGSTVTAGYVSSSPTDKTKQLTTQAAKTVTPTKSEQTAVNSGVYTTGAVKVGAIPDQYIVPSGSETKTANGTYDVTNLAEIVVSVAGGGGGLPADVQALALGEITVNTAFTTSRQTFTHNLGVVPDMIIVMAKGNIAQTYSMLIAIGGSAVTYRGGNYINHLAYHGNSSTTVTWTNANSTSYGVSNFTATTFQLASSSSSYYWRAGTYKYIAIKWN